MLLPLQLKYFYAYEFCAFKNLLNKRTRKKLWQVVAWLMVVVVGIVASRCGLFEKYFCYTFKQRKSFNSEIYLTGCKIPKKPFCSLTSVNQIRFKEIFLTKFCCSFFFSFCLFFLNKFSIKNSLISNEINFASFSNKMFGWASRNKLWTHKDTKLIFN